MLKLKKPISTFRASEQSTEVMADITVPGVINRTGEITSIVEAVCDQLISEFFSDLASRMGSEVDLYDQTYGGAPPPWVPLSRAYAMKKGHSRFWDYQASAKLSKKFKRSRGGRRARFSRRFGPRLITVIRGIDGVAALGPAKIKMKLEGVNFTISERGERYRIQNTDMQRSEMIFIAQNSKTRQGAFFRRHVFAAERFTGTIRLFSKVRSQPELNKIVSFLARSGVIDELSARKLIGKKQYHRPLINSFMFYYANTLLPRRLRAALESARGGVGAAKFTAGSRLAKSTPRTRSR